MVFMDTEIVKRRQRELSKQQAIYVAKRATGASKQQSAIFAGYADVDKAGDQVEKSTLVQEELAKTRAETAKRVEVTKEDIAEWLKDAFDMAKLMADPQAMVRAAAELGKMLGHYAPEVKKVVHGVDAETRAALKGMSDADLLRLARGQVHEGEFKVLRVEPGADEPAF
jgi:hydroxylamine reductase (hybrid-cluster protein)